MVINGVNGQRFELKVMGYQYPDAKNFWDVDWLSIYFEFKSEEEQWQYTDPSLIIGDVRAIVNWFKQLSDNSQPKYADLTFLDTNLSFRLLNEIDFSIKKIRIEKGDKLLMDFEANNNELKVLSAGLADELSKFPMREIVEDDNWDN